MNRPYFLGVFMKTVICQINSKYVHSSLAAWCIKAGVEKFCTDNIEVSVLEGTINENTEDVLTRIVSKEPEIIGFCCYIWNISYVRELAQKVRDCLPECKIVFGGPEVSYNTEEVLKQNNFVDFVISGEGEYPFSYLTDCIEKGTVPENNGICYRKGDGYYISEPYVSCEEPPSPYCEDYFSALRGRIAYIETTRGCPYSCAFCLSGRCGGVRFFDINRVKNEITALANSGTKTVKFIDRTFNAHNERSKDILRFILSNVGRQIPVGVCFHFEIAGDILDDEFISLLTSAPKGLFQLEIGMQSFNEPTLAAINRKTDCEKLKNNIKRLVDARNMHIHIDLIAGLPLENYETFRKSFNTAYELNADMLQLGFLKLLHGADMREYPDKYPCKFSSSPPYEVISTPYITKEELSLLRGVEDALERTYNSGRFRETLRYIEALGFIPFDIFERIAKRLNGSKEASLDEYTAFLYGILCDFEGVDKAVLRDIMLCDRIATVADGKIPKCFRTYDPFLKTTKHSLEKNADTKRRDGVKRTVALLYSEKNVVWCDYTDSDPITGRYELFKLPFDDIKRYDD